MSGQRSETIEAREMCGLRKRGDQLVAQGLLGESKCRRIVSCFDISIVSISL